MRHRRSLLPFALATMVAVSIGAPDEIHAAALPKTVDKCQNVVKKAGGTFITKKLAALTQCTAGVFKCIQTVDETPDGGAKRTACITKARAACLKSLAAITAARQTLVDAVSSACATLDATQVTDAGGLGYASNDCSGFGAPVTSVATLADCVAAQHNCLASRLFQLEMPRALEMIQFTPPPAVAVPAPDIDSLACLQDFGGTGSDVADLTLGKTLVKCEKTIGKTGTKLAGGRLATLEKCVDALFICDQTKTGDDLVACRTKAGASCAKAFTKQDGQSTALAASIATPCGDATVFDALRTPAGGDFIALAAPAIGRAGQSPCGALATIADLQICLETEAAAIAEDLMRFEAPRAESLLAGVGCDLTACGTVATPTATALGATPSPTATPVGATPTATALVATPTATSGGPTSTGKTPTPTPTATVTATPTPTATVTPGGGCPSTYQITFNETGADQDFGWSGLYHDEPITANVRLTMSVSNCANSAAPCGACTLSGPITNAGGSTFANRRCRGATDGSNGSWISCTSDAQCTGTGNACVYFFGPPQPEGGVLPICTVTEIAAPATGTIDLDTGAASFSLVMRVTSIAGIADFHPCPSCTSGTCSAGANTNQPCVVDGTSALTGDGLSLDCPPVATAGNGSLGTRVITTTLGTGLQSVTLDANSPACSEDPASRCFCDTCDNAAGTPCMNNADCVAVGATTCGGRRCLNGPDIGAPCTSMTQCPSGVCGRLGDTLPNDCSDGVCSDNSTNDHDSVNEGICAAGPTMQVCAAKPLFQCFSASDCPDSGDSCVSAQRQCFTDNGAPGNSVSVNGVASVTAPTFGGLMCLGPTTSLAVNTIEGLPGLGRVTLPATALAQ